MNKSIKILRFAALALAVVTALGVGRAYAGIAIPVGPGQLIGVITPISSIASRVRRTRALARVRRIQQPAGFKPEGPH